MMKLKSTTLLLTTLVAGTLWASHTTASAQPTNAPFVRTNTPPSNSPPVARPFRRTGLENLGLTPEVLAKARPIVEEMQKQVVETYRNPALDTPAKQAKMKEIREATVAQLKPILTPEQLTKWEQLSAPPPRRLPPQIKAFATNAPVNVSTNAPQK